MLNKTVVAAPELIADEGHYSVWHKPAGMLSQGSKWGDHCTLSRWVETHDENPRSVFTVHRLDRAANGLMLIAHSKNAARLLAAMFANKTIKKHYHATVYGHFPNNKNTTVFDDPIDNRTARTPVACISMLSVTNRY